MRVFVRNNTFFFNAIYRGAALLTLGLLFLLAGCGGGGGGGGSSSNTVRGIVSDSQNGDKGAEGATITIGRISAVTRTRDNFDATHPIGFFEMQNVPVGTNTAVIQLKGATTAQTIAFTPSVTTGVNPDLELFVNIGQVTGQILLPDGKSPAANAYVTVAATGETIQSDTNGRFLLTLIPTQPGGIETEVLAVKGTASGRKTVTVAYGLNTLDTLTLTDDPSTAPPGQPYGLTGAVTVPGLGAVANTTVILFRNQIQQETGITDSNGKYYFYVPAGQYSVRATRAGYKDTETPTINLTDPSVPVTANLTMENL